jgi:osmotically-inducible protein OsmY
MKKTLWLLLLTASLSVSACSNQSTTSTEPSTPSKTEEPPAGLATNPPAATDADNTARNADQSTLAQTATGQSETKADVEITAAIRKAIVDDKALSVNAHNVKVITSGGVVTLRGPVKSEEEKKTIEAKAKQVAGVTRVDNLLEVEKNP